MSTVIQEPQKPKPPAAPIESLSTDVAKLYSHIHPVLLLSLYAAQFKKIVADPVPALAQTLAGLGVLQVAWAAICLPPTRGGSANVTATIEKKKPGQKKAKEVGKLESGINGKIIVRA
jgi:phosphatidylinositol glycan class F